MSGEIGRVYDTIIKFIEQISAYIDEEIVKLIDCTHIIETNKS